MYGLGDLITMRHLDNMAKVMLATGEIVAYSYMFEAFIAWYSGNQFEMFAIWNRMTGPYASTYWSLIFCNLIFPQILWLKKIRTNVVWLFVVSVDVLVGMWLERYVIVVVSLHRDFLPSSWGMFHPTIWDVATYVGTLGLFFFLFFLFIRSLPMISIFEVRTLLPQAEVAEGVEK
jgi:molybdopterin-containing oxidoreductase family membrane subunit